MWAGCGLLLVGFFALRVVDGGIGANASAAALMSSLASESLRPYVPAWWVAVLLAWPVAAAAALLSLAAPGGSASTYAASAASVLGLTVPVTAVVLWLHGLAPGAGLLAGCAGWMFVVIATGLAVRQPKGNGL